MASKQNCFQQSCNRCHDDDASHCLECIDPRDAIFGVHGRQICVSLSEHCKQFDDGVNRCLQCKTQFKPTLIDKGTYCVLNDAENIIYYASFFSAFTLVMIGILIYMIIKSKPRKDRVRKSRDASSKKLTFIEKLPRANLNADGTFKPVMTLQLPVNIDLNNAPNVSTFENIGMSPKKVGIFAELMRTMIDANAEADKHADVRKPMHAGISPRIGMPNDEIEGLRSPKRLNHPVFLT